MRTKMLEILLNIKTLCHHNSQYFIINFKYSIVLFLWVGSIFGLNCNGFDRMPLFAWTRSLFIVLSLLNRELRRYLCVCVCVWANQLDETYIVCCFYFTFQYCRLNFIIIYFCKFCRQFYGIVILNESIQSTLCVLHNTIKMFMKRMKNIYLVDAYHLKNFM